MRRSILLLVVLTGCEGLIVGDRPGPVVVGDRPSVVSPRPEERPVTSSEPNPCDGATLSVPSSPLRRLTPEQLRNTWTDLLGPAQPIAAIDAFAAPRITELEVERLADAVATIVQRGDHLSLVGCDVAGAGSDACARGFITTLGRRAFRRPLTTEELSWLTGVYTSTRALQVTPAVTFREAIDTVAQVILQAPQVTYLNERGTQPSSPGPTPLTGFERAARLSFFLWNSTPDDALLSAAETGSLDTADGMRAAVERLLASPRARTMVRRFASGWLELDPTPTHVALEKLVKSAARYPFDTPELRVAMRAESEALFERAFFDEGGSFKAVLTSRKAYLNGPLAQLYGVAGPASATTWAWVDLPEQRAGLFTRAAFLTNTAGEEWPSPTRRGTALYRRALGLALPDPPASVDNTPPKPTATTLSVRDRIEVRTQPASCRGCHAVINPLGHTLGHFDAMGQYQANDVGTQNGTPFSVAIDATAEVAAGDLEQTLTGGVELSAALAGSAQASRAMADAWLVRALQRPVGTAEACLQYRARQTLAQTDDMRALLVTLLTSDEALSISGDSP